MVETVLDCGMMKNTNNLNTENMTQYNGWTNYETWRINLEMLDGMTPEDFGLVIAESFNDPELGDEREEAIATLANSLDAYVTELVEMDAKGFALDLARDFLNKVDWQEIAEHMAADYATEMV